MSHARIWRIAALLAALALCLWIGWHDVDLRVPREVVQTEIRMTIRRTLQVGLQWLAPAVLLALLMREIRRRSTQRRH